MLYSASGNYSQLNVSARKSGLLIPTGVDILSAEEKIAEQYRQDAINQATLLMQRWTPEMIASFLSTKASQVEMMVRH